MNRTPFIHEKSLTSDQTLEATKITIPLPKAHATALSLQVPRTQQNFGMNKNWWPICSFKNMPLFFKQVKVIVKRFKGDIWIWFCGPKPNSSKNYIFLSDPFFITQFVTDQKYWPH